tara:strand:+ start:2829 stop:3419 length:591 start_codon:yes stop_codon:yes gene_type:complete
MLTEKEQEVYDFIIRYRDDNGYSPLLREIASSIGIKSKGVVHRYIKSLEKSGLIACHSNKHRGFSIIGHKKIFNINSLGKISAGGPIEAVPDQDILELEHMFSNEKCYALKVQGDSMIDAGIHDNDWVIVEKTNKISNSKVAVILIDNQDVTLKYYKLLNKDTVELIPANKKFDSTIYHISRISIQGIVIGQIRVY